MAFFGRLYADATGYETRMVKKVHRIRPRERPFAAPPHPEAFSVDGRVENSAHGRLAPVLRGIDFAC